MRQEISISSKIFGLGFDVIVFIEVEIYNGENLLILVSSGGYSHLFEQVNIDIKLIYNGIPILESSICEDKGKIPKIMGI